MTKIVEKKFKVGGMHCVSCAMTIDFDLEDIDGVTSAKTSYATSECRVIYDEEKLDHQVIISKIKKTGYSADVVNTVKE
jgi:copper chaperone CopZ